MHTHTWTEIGTCAHLIGHARYRYRAVWCQACDAYRHEHVLPRVQVQDVMACAVLAHKRERG